jgi:hypothetical protein
LAVDKVSTDKAFLDGPTEFVFFTKVLFFESSETSFFRGFIGAFVGLLSMDFDIFVAVAIVDDVVGVDFASSDKASGWIVCDSFIS